MSGPIVRSRGGRFASFLAILSILLIPAGCGYLQSYVDLVKEKGVSPQYLSVLDTWTRTKGLTSQFETRADLFATFKSAEFRAAYVKDYARLYGLTEEQMKSRREVLDEMASDFDEFFFYAAMPDRDANDFDKSGSVWKIYLYDARGNRFEPMEVRRIIKVSSLVTAFYPYVNPYHGNCYTLKFKAGSVPKGGSFKLVFTGVLGKVELSWP
ncbi:MAG: hypothetical protein HPY65_00095 [Syntrophaceae bacterium]|nr:hypothetical protein [Syntrophaceae bacterium]